MGDGKKENKAIKLTSWSFSELFFPFFSFSELFFFIISPE